VKKLALSIATPLLVLSSLSATAQYDFFDESLPIVISASRLNQSVLTSPTSVTVINKEMIEASGFIEFVDLMRLVPGFQVAHAQGRRFAVGYHGYASDIGNHLQVLVNGRSTYSPTLSTVNWDFLGIQLQDIDRIEVVRGSSASAYGSNSFRAAINIITKSPDLDNLLYAHVRVGNQGERHQLVRFSDEVGETNYRITASSRDNEGFDNFRDTRDIQQIAFQAKMNHWDDHPMEIHLFVAEGKLNSNSYQQELQLRDVDVKSWSAHFSGEKILSGNQDIKWNLYHNDDDFDDFTESNPLLNIFDEEGNFEGIDLTPVQAQQIFGVATGQIIPAELALEILNSTFEYGDETNRSSKTDLEFVYNTSEHDKFFYMLGIGARRDSLHSRSYFQSEEKTSEKTYRLFMNGSVNLNQDFSFNGGVIYEYVDDFKGENIGKLSPRASLNYQIHPNQSLRLAISQGYRLLSLLEKNGMKSVELSPYLPIDELFTVDDNLKPEKIRQIDIAYLGESSSLPLNWEFKLYKEDVSDLIDFPELAANDFNGKLQQTINLASHEAYGLEGEINYRHNDNTSLRFVFNIGDSESSVFVRLSPEPAKETYSNSMPKNSFGLLATTQLDNWQMSLGAYYMDETTWISSGDEDLEAYSRVDASISRNFFIGENNLKIRLGAQAIDNSYIDYNRDTLFEPRYYMTVSLSKD
jgi:iron complex outermembrane receptor protein